MGKLAAVFIGMLVLSAAPQASFAEDKSEKFAGPGAHRQSDQGFRKAGGTSSGSTAGSKQPVSWSGKLSKKGSIDSDAGSRPRQKGDVDPDDNGGAQRAPTPTPAR